MFVRLGSQERLTLPAGRDDVTLTKELGLSGGMDLSLERVGP